MDIEKPSLNAQKLSLEKNDTDFRPAREVVSAILRNVSGMTLEELRNLDLNLEHRMYIRINPEAKLNTAQAYAVGDTFGAIINVASEIIKRIKTGDTKPTVVEILNYKLNIENSLNQLAALVNSLQINKQG
jgi:hypothetical protein